MVTDRDLFLAILALDAYNHNYNPGIVGLSDAQLGTATYDKQLAATDAGFYARSYTLADGSKVISYRGTSFPGHPDYGDVLNGWALSPGYAGAV
jgi:hypothetical protein